MSLRLDGRSGANLQLPPQPLRLALSMLTTVLFEAAILGMLFYVGRSALEVTGVLPDRSLAFVFLPQQKGAGGGGGGGGNQMPDPPRPAETPGRDLMTVPVKPIESIQATLEPAPASQLVLPVQTLAAGVQESLGALQMPAGPSTLCVALDEAAAPDQVTESVTDLAMAWALAQERTVVSAAGRPVEGVA